MTPITEEEFDEAWLAIEEYPDDYEPELVELLLSDHNRVVKLIQEQLLSYKNELSFSGPIKSSSPLYIFFLASYLGEREFAEPLLDLLKENFERSFPYLPDIFDCESLPSILSRVVGEDVGLLKDFIVDRHNDDESRRCAVSALACCSVAGKTEIKDTKLFLSGLFKGDEAEKGSIFWTEAFNYLCDLGSSNYLELYKDISARGLLDSSFSPTLKQFEDEIAEDDDIRMEHISSFYQDQEFHEDIEQLHEAFRGWLEPSDEEVAQWWDAPNEPTPSDSFSGVVDIKKKEKNKKRKKLAKKSRKKNRR